MKITVLGKGMVGGALGRSWARLGHDVTFGVRDPDDAGALALREGGAGVGLVRDAVVGADVVVLAVPWAAVGDVLSEVGPLGGVILIDTTNAVAPGYRHGVETGSGAEAVQRLVPAARVVKAFNGMSFRTMEDAHAFPTPPVLLIAGDDADAKATVADLGAELGLEPVDAGPLSASALLEPAAVLWIRLAYEQGLGREFAFAIVRKTEAA